MFICLIAPSMIKATTSLREIYISVTDAKTAIQEKDEQAFKQHFKEIKDTGKK